MINPDLLSIGNYFWHGMANHLWQSTLFAVSAWLITLFLKKNRARIRYRIWVTVSVKFLLPFSLIVNLGGLIAPEGLKAPDDVTPKLNIIQTINQPFKPSELKEISPAIDTIDTRNSSNMAPWIIFTIWLCGSSTVFLMWYRQNTQLSGIVKKAELLRDGPTVKGFHRIKLENRISHTVRLVSTRDTMEPGVFGIIHPVIMLPAEILENINDSELETILLHECAHIQYRDNLIAFIHMLVEALFWFHPFVWWTGSRLVSERELACDQSVLRSGKSPRTYAEGILKVCEHYFISPMPCVSGVIGSRLNNRIEGILKKQIGHKLSLTQIFILSLFGLLTLFIPLTIGMLNAPSSRARPTIENSIGPVAEPHKLDNSKASVKRERNIESSGMVTLKADTDVSPPVIPAGMLWEERKTDVDNASKPRIAVESSLNNSKTSRDKVPTQAGIVSDQPSIRNNSPLLAMANADTQTAITSETETGPSATIQESVSDFKIEESGLLAQTHTPLKRSPDTANRDNNSGIQYAGNDQNQNISGSNTPSTTPEKYDLDNEYQALDRITLFGIRSYENIDKQSLILRTNYSDYYLLVLQRPRFEVSYGKTGIDFHGSTIIAGHDRVVMDYPSKQHYIIDKIYKLKGRKQVTEIKKLLREE